MELTPARTYLKRGGKPQLFVDRSFATNVLPVLCEKVDQPVVSRSTKI